MTRIIAGSLGGRRIEVPKSGTRPTSDRVREAVFNALSARVDFAGLAVLDLYAGSGALGLEAISRGASSALFVESDQRAAAVITKNIAALKVIGATVRRGTAESVLAAGTSRPVDLVLADPPYDVDARTVDAVVAALADGGWVRAGTIVMVERRANSAAVTWPAGWAALSARRYGDTRVELAEVEQPGMATPA
ncbi:16S rRNA (guanine(966)-N(2))-methyltransferase RsmD [Mycolicibacterium goodii]|uniref:16S rRNA (Guanine(966)-N(2))-methyltransferase RsmD n=1 Tax=Mycolicibacterium goodii TaxID=134601 RepID=A0ABS6HJB0_MYCGD|nr:16S rRNA (guanine(966)-N(2))-methyltransferase RsmD [Mycolicibacterium goodii]MBU8822675.1 16S rRNA (guanine(966)-N(2))-methyltransferase RsmD [Mycolicibacterium goodii]MBU8835052.1 16S rRNA (guanine(966)-N(2))-methyltransferase RsmD [Mycolicibacterium goodii]ULN50789.1 16S rRNA (guanine(966)-N(2))-methyltransferase RsmD [Mycolicibacterium goodii]